MTKSNCVIQPSERAYFKSQNSGAIVHIQIYSTYLRFSSSRDAIVRLMRRDYFLRNVASVEGLSRNCVLSQSCDFAIFCSSTPEPFCAVDNRRIEKSPKSLAV